MTWSVLSVSHPTWGDAMQAIVTGVVRHFKQRGHKRDFAIEQASLALGLSQRKARSIYYGEPFAAARADYDALKRAYRRHLDTVIADLEQRSEEARLQREQMEFGFDQTED